MKKGFIKRICFVLIVGIFASTNFLQENKSSSTNVSNNLLSNTQTGTNVEVDKYGTLWDVDLSAFDLSVVDNSLVITEKAANAYDEKSLKSNSRKIDSNELQKRQARKEFAKSFLESKLEDSRSKENLKNLVSDLQKYGKKLLSLGVTKVNFKKVKDANGKEMLQPVENNIGNNDVSQNNNIKLLDSSIPSYNYDGSCELWTTVSYIDGWYRHLWVQANLYWSTFPTVGGRDFIGVSWDQNWTISNSNYKITTVDYLSSSTNPSWVQPSYADSNSNSIVWGFLDSIKLNGYEDYTSGVYAGAEIFNGPQMTQTFRSKYVHTYLSLGFSASASSSSTGFNVYPESNQYPVSNHCTTYM